MQSCPKGTEAWSHCQEPPESGERGQTGRLARSDTHPSLHGTPASQETSFILKARVPCRMTERPPRPSASVPVRDFTQTGAPRTHRTPSGTGRDGTGRDVASPGSLEPAGHSPAAGQGAPASAPAGGNPCSPAAEGPAPGSASCPETQLSQHKMGRGAAGAGWGKGCQRQAGLGSGARDTSRAQPPPSQPQEAPRCAGRPQRARGRQGLDHHAQVHAEPCASRSLRGQDGGR